MTLLKKNRYKIEKDGFEKANKVYCATQNLNIMAINNFML